MRSHQFLAWVSAAQLVCGCAGMALAVRRRHAFDILFRHGQDSAVARDSLLMGTALSAPVVLLGAQACATAVLFRQPSRAAERLLGGLGATMVVGYLAERLVRQRLLLSGWEAMESSVVISGIGLAAVMALLGLRPRA